MKTCTTPNCTAPCYGYNGVCRECGKKLTALKAAAAKVVTRKGLTVDRAGCAYWAWDARGEVVVTGRDTMPEVWTALVAL